MRPPLRVLQVSTSDAGGGAERIAMTLHDGYRSEGADAWMAVGYRRTASPRVLSVENDRARGLLRSKLIVAGELLARRVGAAGPAVRDVAMAVTTPRRLLDALRGHEDFAMPASRRLLSLTPVLPDVVHCHNLHGGYFDLRELASLSRRLPVFLTLHDMWSFTGHCASSLSCERWRTGCGECPDLGLPPSLRRDGTSYNLRRKRDVYRRCRLRVASPSRWLLEKARASVLATGAVEWRVIPHGVDLRVFHPDGREHARRRLGLAPGARVLLYVAGGGRANPYKDYATVARALEAIAARSAPRDVVLLVVGGDEPAQRRGRIQLVPRLEDARDLADHYRAANLLLYATRADNFPNAVLESLACGTPVVATAVGGIPEQIEHGKTGFLVPAGDAIAMADAAVRAMGEERILLPMRARASAAARERFDSRRHARDYLRWFDDVARPADAPGRHETGR